GGAGHICPHRIVDDKAGKRRPRTRRTLPPVPLRRPRRARQLPPTRAHRRTLQLRNEATAPRGQDPPRHDRQRAAREAHASHPAAVEQSDSLSRRQWKGLSAPGAKLRPLVVPRVEEPRRKRPARPPPDITGTFLEVLPDRPQLPPVPARYRIPWAKLLERVFGVDVLACTKCKGRMKVIALLEQPCAVRAILRHLGLPDTPLPVARSRGPPEPTFDW